LTTRIDEHLDRIHGIEAEMLQLLDGMDYCLDWKPDASAWSARQVVYHLVETPEGGLHPVLWGILSGELKDFEIWADQDNLTPDRLTYDVEQLREDIGEFFRGMSEALETATDDDLDSKAVLAHHRKRGRDDERTLQMLLDGLFAHHWRSHLEQIGELRMSLGM
jgi:inactivated superfamily I helicase